MKNGSVFVAVVVLMTLCGVSIAMIKPAFPLKDLDPIDACLFVCSMCYQKEMLLECANGVCLRDLGLATQNTKGSGLGRLWARSCPGLLEFFRK